MTKYAHWWSWSCDLHVCKGYLLIYVPYSEHCTLRISPRNNIHTNDSIEINYFFYRILSQKCVISHEHSFNKMCDVI